MLVAIKTRLAYCPQHSYSAYGIEEFYQKRLNKSSRAGHAHQTRKRGVHLLLCVISIECCSECLRFFF